MKNSRNLLRFLPLALCFSTMCAQAYDVIPLWESRNVSTTTTFYTTYINDNIGAQANDQHEQHGIAAWLPCSSSSLNGPNGEISYKGSTSYPDVPTGDWITPSRFRHGYTTDMNFPCVQPSGSLPIYRMYKGPPETDHFYTTSVTEFNAKKAAGYGFDRVEGFIFTTQVAGSVPFYRLSIGANIPNHDVEHRYTISASARQSLLTAGWTDEGIFGYVFATNPASSVASTQFTGTFNGYTVSPTTITTVPIRNVVPPVSQLTLGGNSTTAQYGTLSSLTTVKPASAVRQQLTFKIYTGDLFTATSRLDHIPMYLHYTGTSSRSELSVAGGYDGVALVFAKPTFVRSSFLNCATGTPPATGGQLFIEIAEGAAMLCATLAQPLAANQWYTFIYSIDDSANMHLEAYNSLGFHLAFLDGSTALNQSLLSYYPSHSPRPRCPLAPAFGSLAPSETYCLNPYSGGYAFPVANTGYTIVPIFLPASASDITGQISNVAINWLNSAGVIVH